MTRWCATPADPRRIWAGLKAGPYEEKADYEKPNYEESLADGPIPTIFVGAGL